MPTFGMKADTGRVYLIMARCDEHKNVPQLNATVDGLAECGACLGQDLYDVDQMILDLLDGYAERLTHHCLLQARLASARERLELLEPGAGEYLDG